MGALKTAKPVIDHSIIWQLGMHSDLSIHRFSVVDLPGAVFLSLPCFFIVSEQIVIDRCLCTWPDLALSSGKNKMMK